MSASRRPTQLKLPRSPAALLLAIACVQETIGDLFFIITDNEPLQMYFAVAKDIIYLSLLVEITLKFSGMTTDLS
jgi:hypothetical protein